jgi:hypothetical protein
MALAGAGQFVPSFGKEGVMVMIGGVVPTNSWDTSGALRSMTNITIFDPETGSWYSQTATGDVPMARKNMCVVGAQSNNGSTYEMYPSILSPSNNPLISYTDSSSAAGTATSMRQLTPIPSAFTFCSSPRSTGYALRRQSPPILVLVPTASL